MICPRISWTAGFSHTLWILKCNTVRKTGKCLCLEHPCTSTLRIIWSSTLASALYIEHPFHMRKHISVFPPVNVYSTSSHSVFDVGSSKSRMSCHKSSFQSLHSSALPKAREPTPGQSHIHDPLDTTHLQNNPHHSLDPPQSTAFHRIGS